MTFTIFFIRPRLIWREWRSTLFIFPRGFLGYFLPSPDMNVLQLTPRLLLEHRPTIPEIDKAIILRDSWLHTHMESHNIEVSAVSPLVLLVPVSYQYELHTVIWLLQMNTADNGNARVFIPIVQERSHQSSLGRIYEKSTIWGVVREVKGGEEIRDILAVAQPVFHVEE